MPERNLRVTKWLGTVPAAAVCTRCSRQFNVPLAALKRLAEAQASLNVQFARHNCESRTSDVRLR